ncbi:MAG: PEP/pyruvate-binding domain-containing protein [Candidatus Sericytochromatia bacterium]
MADLILDAQSGPECLPDLGGKGAQLYALSRAGLPVPSWFCLSAGAFETALASLEARLHAQTDPVELQQWLALAFPEAAVTAALKTRLDPQRRYAVRSSAVGEDSGRNSFAGQFETWLQVPAEQVPLQMMRCWQSACAPRVWHYLRERGIDPTQLRMAVVVQEMCDSEAAGVMFMANPVGALTEVVINAGFGLGEGVVSDSVETDTYLYDRQSRQWSLQIHPKYFQVLPGRFDGTERVPVPAELSRRAVLDAEQCQSLLELGWRVEALKGAYQDIEWALDRQGNFWLLQTRPITTLLQGEQTLFDNSNVVESYPGITSPLTFSWIRGAYGVLFRNALLKLGVQEARRRDDIFEQMVAHLHGRVYYNLSNWYRMFRLIPGTEGYIRIWEDMMGIHQPAPAPGHSLEWRRHLVPWLGIVLRLLWHFLTLGAQLRRFRQHFETVSARFWAAPASENAHALLRRYQALCADLLNGWEITVLNDGYAFIFTGLAKAGLKRAGFFAPTALFNDLLCGQAGMESVEPVRSVVALAEHVRAHPALQLALPAQLERYDFGALQQLDPIFAEALQTHLRVYGDRCLAELKLETVTLREDPRLLLRWVRDYSASALTRDDMRAHEQGIRAAAEKRLRQESRLPVWEKPLLAFCLAQARRCINYRESSRLDRARAFGLVRQLFRRLGHDLYLQDLLPSPEAVFSLTLEELQTLVHGSGPGYDWPELLAWRSQQLQLWQAEALPERVLCQGPVGVHLLPLRRQTPAGLGSVLVGTGCAPGRVTAQAMVIRDPAQAEDVQGKILVAEMTDPGWVFLMIQAAGLVVEKGSLLSHTAIIGRELGIPTVVGVPDATRRIQSGQILTLDGQRGEVHLA